MWTRSEDVEGRIFVNKLDRVARSLELKRARKTQTEKLHEQ